MVETTAVIHGGHLQIVCGLQQHNELLKVQSELFPDSLIVTPAVLQLFHNAYYTRYMDRIKHVSYNAVWYILPLHTYGAIEGSQCNGIRYGTQPCDYISLPQIKPFTGE